VKKILFATALVAALVPMAVAQAPTAAATAVRGGARVSNNHVRTNALPKGTIYYSGDIDTTLSNANALFNENNTSESIAAQVVSNFSVTKAESVTSVYINAFTDTGSITNPTPWSILKGVKTGVGGKSVCKGTGTAKVTPTGRTDTNWGVPTEDQVIVKLKKACALKPGKYFLSIYPTSTSLWYESDEESDPKPIHHKGTKNIIDNHFFNSSAFGFTWANTTTVCGSGAGCDEFSFGLVGK